MRHLPRRYFSGTELSDLSQLRDGEEVAVMAEVVDARVFNMPSGSYRSAKKPRLEATITDHKGSLTCTFFGQPRLIDYWHGQLQPGARGIFAGKVKEFNRKLQLAHPDFVIVDESGAIIGGAARNAALASASQAAFVGLYPMTGKLRTWTIADCVTLALESLAGIEDPLPEWVRAEAEVWELERALRAVHQPTGRAEIDQGRERLRFDEAFALQLTMAYRRADAASHHAVPRPRRSGGLLDAFDARLPFTLTQGQVEISEQLMAELARPQPMQRLLQGEVGSGKTLVALRAMLAVVDAGGQAALLAPTEVLAGQHLQTITRLLGDLADGGTLGAADHATRVVLLTGSMSAAQKREAMAGASSGEAGIVIGTHALLSAGVQFADLGFVVVDEQHRFGVEQRAALSAKADARPHVLVMTATPIPRSVAMTVFGDLETSTLREIPAGRAEVSTVVVDAARQPAWVQRSWQRIVEEVGQGRQAFVVCARISSTDPAGSAATPRTATCWRRSEDLPPAVAVEDLYAELSSGPLAGVRVDDAARPVAGRGEGRGDGPVRGRSDRRAGGDHRRRGRGGRAERFGDGDLRRRPLRDLPAASAPRPDRPRGASRRLPAAHRRAAGQPGAATARGGGQDPGRVRARRDRPRTAAGGRRARRQPVGQPVESEAAAGARRRRADRRRPHPRRALHRGRPRADRRGPGRHRDRHGDGRRRRLAGAHVSRIIAGSRGGRRLTMPSGDRTRPTTDRVREALFSALTAWAGTSAAAA